MKTYALFGSNSKQPLQTYEGEEMVQNKEYVSIFKRVRRQNSPLRSRYKLLRFTLAPASQ